MQPVPFFSHPTYTPYHKGLHVQMHGQPSCVVCKLCSQTQASLPCPLPRKMLPLKSKYAHDVGMVHHWEDRPGEKAIRPCKHVPHCLDGEFKCPKHPEAGVVKGEAGWPVALGTWNPGVLKVRPRAVVPQPRPEDSSLPVALETCMPSTLAAVQPTLPNMMGLERELCVCSQGT